MARHPTILGLLACLALTACGGKGAAVPTLQVTGVLPRSAGSTKGSREHPEPLWLNSRITVHFSENIDRLSVTGDTIRVVRITDNGPQRVALAGFRILARSVELMPEWPVTRQLDDGSFVPGALYRLEVEGFPLTNTVQGRSGALMGDSYHRYFRAVAQDVQDPGPLLPEGLPSDPFELAVPRLRVAADTRSVRLRFTLPVDPTTLSPRGFRVTQGGADIEVSTARVVAHRSQGAVSGGPRYPNTVVELRLAAGQKLDARSLLGVDIRPDDRAEHWVRDFRGRPVSERSHVVSGVVYEGSKVELKRFEGAMDIPLQRVDPKRLSFECRGGRIQPLARREYGTGALGVFRPTQDTVLSPGTPIYQDGGFVYPKHKRLEFAEIHIPKGVTVILRANRTLPSSKVDVVAFGDIRIDGSLILETNHAIGPGEFEAKDDERYLERVVAEDFGCRLACAGNLIVNGSIAHRMPDETKATPLVLMARAMVLHGGVPAGSILVYEPGRIPVGVARDVVQMVDEQREAGYVPGRTIGAAAWTEWQKLEDFDGGPISARAIDPREGVEVLIQVAKPDPIDPSQPYRDPTGMSEPRRLPLRQPIQIGKGAFVRFQLRGKVVGDQQMPSVRALVVLAN